MLCIWYKCLGHCYIYPELVITEMLILGYINGMHNTHMLHYSSALTPAESPLSLFKSTLIIHYSLQLSLLRVRSHTCRASTLKASTLTITTIITCRLSRLLFKMSILRAHAQACRAPHSTIWAPSLTICITITRHLSHLQSLYISIQMGARMLVIGVLDVGLCEDDSLRQLTHFRVGELDHAPPETKGTSHRNAAPWRRNARV